MINKFYIITKGWTTEQRQEIVDICFKAGFASGWCDPYYKTYINHQITNNAVIGMRIKRNIRMGCYFSSVMPIENNDEEIWAKRHSYKKISIDEFRKIGALWARNPLTDPLLLLIPVN